MSHTDRTIVVRDRRKKQQYTIHNRIIDEWVPIIGMTGLGLYNLYARMANEEGTSWPGTRFICKHLRVGKTTVTCHNALLEWCELILIDPGNRARPNTYYILEIPDATQERRQTIRDRAAAALGQEQSKERPNASRIRFWRGVIERVESWQSAQAHWDGGHGKLQVRDSRQQSRFSPQEREIGESLQAQQDGGGTREGHLEREGGIHEYHWGTHEHRSGSHRYQGGIRGIPEDHDQTDRDDDSEIHHLMEDLTLLGIDAEGAAAVIAAHGVARTRQALALTLKRNADNPPGYLMTCVTGSALKPMSAHEIDRIIQRHRLLREYQEHHCHGQTGCHAEGCHDAGDPLVVLPIHEDLPPDKEIGEPLRSQHMPDWEKASQAWQTALGELELQMTKATFAQWVRPLKAISLKGDVFTLAAPTEYIKDWVENRLRLPIQRTLSAILEDQVEIVVSVEGENDRDGL